jgi:NAD(P)-dependent dehydrogenase (short-subunit alcohol dehydrogenase family)
MSVVAGAYRETALITGSNQGIGLEFARQYAERHWTVIATHRRASPPEKLVMLRAQYPNVRIERMDVSDHAQIDALATRMNGEPIDVIVNNAALIRSAFIADRHGNANQLLGTLDYRLFNEFMYTNVAGPLRIAEAFGPNVKSSKMKKFITVSSAAGSVSIAPGAADHYWYRISKAAVNMAMRVLALDFHKDAVIVALFHPGGVRTESLRTLDMAGLEAPELAVAKLVKVIDRLTMNDTGRFLRSDWTDHPW